MRVVVAGRRSSRTGAAVRDTMSMFVRACRDIGGLLARHDHTLVVTSDADSTADRAAVEGYAAVVSKKRSLQHRIELVSPFIPPPDLFPALRREMPALFTWRSVNALSMDVARFRACMEADATIIVCGGTGTESTAYVALAARRLLVPVASFGGAASAVLTELVARRAQHSSLPPTLDAGVLAQDWSPEVAQHLDRWLHRAGRRRDVFVVYGRNIAARDAVYRFLRSLDLNPLEWNELVRAVGKGAPYVGDVLDHGFARAQACVVLFTGDEYVSLRRELGGGQDSALQPRPNVLFEAGMALAHHPDRTLIVQLGPLREQCLKPVDEQDHRGVVPSRSS